MLPTDERREEIKLYLEEGEVVEGKRLK